MKTLLFAKRNFMEIVRDPLSYLFCLGFPIAMLILFVIINSYSNNNTPMFKLDELAPSIAVFSFSFIMLFMTLLVSKDRTTSFLTRLYTSPMTTWDFLWGYSICGIVLGIMQTVICYIASVILGICVGDNVSILALLRTMPFLIPELIIFVGFGVLFGGILSDKSAPGISSIIISVSGIAGGIWMPLDQMGNFATLCKCLPFYPAVLCSRAAFRNNFQFDEMWLYFLMTVCWAAIVIAITVLILSKTMKSQK